MSLAWSVIPFSKWLTTMVRKSPKDRIMFFSWLINGGDPNHVSKSWDDPPSAPGSFQDIHEALEEVFPFDHAYFG